MITNFNQAIALFTDSDATFKVSVDHRSSCPRQVYLLNDEGVEVRIYMCSNDYLMFDYEGYLEGNIDSWAGCCLIDSIEETLAAIGRMRDIY